MALRKRSGAQGICGLADGVLCKAVRERMTEIPNRSPAHRHLLIVFGTSAQRRCTEDAWPTISSTHKDHSCKPAITVNNYGKGQAVYVAVPSQMSVMAPLVRSLYSDLGIEKGPETPAGVYARVVEKRTLYVNTTGEEKTIPIHGSKHGLVSGASFTGLIRLKPYEVDLVE